ncbi:RibD family protein [Aerosakkonemataceae cyanobacterium BLCC-F154]|uniref:RibD family protein n=1 Tax=Floridaenema fluviatile BLCC-F154 TaxID=3153640 RepID=A0ABV4YEQ9_9CYAN
MEILVTNRPYTIVVLAMSADGKIADVQASPARFGSGVDKAHLEKQIALVDGVLFGAGTLRAYGTTLMISDPELLEQRELQGKKSQPTHIVCSGSGKIDPKLRFFQQPVPRWLFTTIKGSQIWQGKREFHKVFAIKMLEEGINWVAAGEKLAELGLQKVAVLGGGKLVASLLEADLVDEFWLTVCPLILGGENAPSPVAGAGFLANLAPKLQLLSVKTVDQEVFLHYRLQR